MKNPCNHSSKRENLLNKVLKYKIQIAHFTAIWVAFLSIDWDATGYCDWEELLQQLEDTTIKIPTEFLNFILDDITDPAIDKLEFHKFLVLQNAFIGLPVTKREKINSSE